MDGGAPSDPGRSPAQAAHDEDRTAHERLVDAAIELIVEHHDRDVGADRRLRDVFPFLSLSRIAERAGVSRATIYHHWREPDETRAVETGATAVLDRLLDDVAGVLWARSVEPDEVLDTEVAPRGTGPDGGVTIEDIVLAASEAEAQRFAGPSRRLMRASQALTLHGAIDPAAAAMLLEELASLYSALAEGFGLRVAAPLSMNDIAFLLSISFEGFVLGTGSGRPVLAQRYPRPGTPPTDATGAQVGHDDVSLVSLVVHPILFAVLEPIPAGSDGGDDRPDDAGTDGESTDGGGTDGGRTYGGDTDSGAEHRDGAASPARVSAGQATRGRIVAAAVDLALEHYAEAGPVDLRVSLAYLTPGAVAERAGTSRPLLYHHWGDGSDAFVDFLTDVVAELWRRAAAPDDLLGAAELVGSDPSELVRVLANLEGGRLRGPHGPLIRAGQALLLDGLVGRAQAESVADGLAEMYRLLVAGTGLVPANGLTFGDIATAIELVTEGYWLQGNVLPEQLGRRFTWRSRVAERATASTAPTVPTEDWSLLAIAVDLVLAALLEPAEPPADAEPAAALSSPRRPSETPRPRG